LDLGGPFSYFRFTSVERDRPTGMFYRLQFIPGELTTVLLGGVPVVTGIIENRQVAYDAHRHGIEISGKSFTSWWAKSSVKDDTGNFDNMNLEAVAAKVLAAYGTSAISVGNVNKTPFDKLQNQPGEPVYDFIERLARVRGAVLGSTSFGQFLLIGQHSNEVVANLQEGQNIKKMQCIIKKEYSWETYTVIAQTAASDQNAGAQAAQLKASWGGFGVLGSTLITPAEQPVKTIQEVLDRARNEAKVNEGTMITAEVTVQGWFRDQYHLWWPGDRVQVYSPMCPLDMTMKIQKVVFSQDSANGTETTLTLLQPWVLNDNGSINVGATGNSTATPAPSAKSLLPTGLAGPGSPTGF
jgi:prophage tail gpP-like protein